MHFTLQDKVDISSLLLGYYLMTKVKAAMDQFIEGLESLSILRHIRENPKRWKEYFVDAGVAVDAGKMKLSSSLGITVIVLIYLKWGRR